MKTKNGESIVDIFVERASDATGHKVFHTLNLEGEVRRTMGWLGEAVLRGKPIKEDKVLMKTHLMAEEGLSRQEARTVVNDVVSQMRLMLSEYKKDM